MGLESKRTKNLGHQTSTKDNFKVQSIIKVATMEASHPRAETKEVI